ncbi:hypothetical protein PQ460_11010 [Paenibacillus sp. KACC 21273]|uniref:hypothetical protein n=1 Tax=Paenibacillus sp. KACC 21273 TaxID=3025665 RepID=UPI002365706F|nr:hypothetical protein [Paenibacillus sp. KACC 21273]WDF52913.1 hypothetical protein PQ460_11010 [Paenibacillus sp. KACC 21273]
MFSPQRIKEDNQSNIEFIAENLIDLLGRDFEGCTIGPPKEELSEGTLIHSILPDHVLNAMLNVLFINNAFDSNPSLLLMTLLDEEE